MGGAVSALNELLRIDAAFRKEFSGSEPTFEVRVNDALEGTFTRSKLIEDNEDLDLVEWATTCGAVGNFYQTGGGAAPVIIVTRVS
jgi:hypothetical protein